MSPIICRDKCLQSFIFMISGNNGNKMLEIIVIGGQYRDFIVRRKRELDTQQCNYCFMIGCL